MADDEFTFEDAINLNPRLSKKPKLKLSGTNGNAYSILGRARDALKKAGFTAQEIEGYYTEATSGDYDHLLMVTQKWFDVS